MMDENEIVLELMPEPTPEQREAEEKEREAREEAIYGPSRRAAQQRQNSAQIVEEHDNLLADMLYEITMNQFGEEV